jgi:hypothetical protein
MQADAVKELSERATWERIKTAAFRGLPTRAVTAAAGLAAACVAAVVCVAAEAAAGN